MQYWEGTFDDFKYKSHAHHINKNSQVDDIIMVHPFSISVSQTHYLYNIRFSHKFRAYFKSS